ncbi:hypothetical protein [Flammeovirga sp. SJP92]|uniref:hypothetical protein n=1 Tax=Flammeovirga sp. SJP92 TaxID=1775430 RepID=UPI0007959CA2|nr:hypothetical protein [Flammeovirga sp. SJP92]KXX68188.1 hypothetical protein AVL50_20540 [Flammeovirga sp. SJP92]
MKSLKHTLVIALIATFSVGSLFAGPADNEDIEIKLLRESVENASANDWAAYSKAAERCIQMQSNLSEAYVWIEKSIEIDENSATLEVKGDYLALNGLKDMAIETYNKAILEGMSEGKDIEKLQWKVLKLSRR